MNAVLEHLTAQAGFEIAHEEYGYRIVRYFNPNDPPERPFSVKRRTGVNHWMPVMSFETIDEAMACLTRTKREMDAMRKRDVARASATGLFLYGLEDEGRRVLTSAGHPDDASWVQGRANSMRERLKGSHLEPEMVAHECAEASAIRQGQAA